MRRGAQITKRRQASTRPLDEIISEFPRPRKEALPVSPYARNTTHHSLDLMDLSFGTTVEFRIGADIFWVGISRDMYAENRTAEMVSGITIEVHSGDLSRYTPSLEACDLDRRVSRYLRVGQPFNIDDFYTSEPITDLKIVH